jgi:hypothetical protein
MDVLALIAEVERKVPLAAPPGTRGEATLTVRTPYGVHTVAAAARIDPQGRRREQFWCDGVRVERHVLLRLICSEAECPHAMGVRAQWLTYHGRRVPAKLSREHPGARPLIVDIPVVVGRHRFIARPARFACFTRCPLGAHPPMTIQKSGFDLFEEEGACLGGGVVELGGVRQPRIPTVRAAEAFVLARQFEAHAALAAASESSRPQRGPPNNHD